VTDYWQFSVSVLTVVLSGLISFLIARHQTKLAGQQQLAAIERQFEFSRQESQTTRELQISDERADALTEMMDIIFRLPALPASTDPISDLLDYRNTLSAWKLQFNLANSRSWRRSEAPLFDLLVNSRHEIQEYIDDIV